MIHPLFAGIFFYFSPHKNLIKKRLLGILHKYKIPKLNLPHSFFWEDLEEGKNTRDSSVTPKVDLGFSPGK